MKVEFQNVCKSFGREIAALHNIKLTIRPGEFVFLVGPSGAGKSTMLRLVYRDLVPTRGYVLVDNRNVSRMGRLSVPYFRRKIGVVFQDFKLLYRKTVFENVAFALKVQGRPSGEIKSKVCNVLKLVGLLEKRNLNPHRLAGGEQQRVAIARAIVNQPSLVIADEPTGNLDETMSAEIFDLFQYLNSHGSTVIIATHNTGLVRKINSRVVVLRDGRITADALAEDIL